jgi:hypothetical protein
MGPLRLPQVRAYAACMETLAFVGRDLSPGETLVRVITAHIDRHANAIAVIAQADGAHLVASRSIRGEREMKNEFADLDAALLDRVIITLVDSIHDGGLETPPTKSVGKLGSPKVMGVLLTSGPPPSMPRSAMPERRGTLQA